MMQLAVLMVLLWSAEEGRGSPVEGLGADSFTAQVEQLIDRIKMPAEDLARMSVIMDDVERVLRTHWPGCQIKPFGSTVTGLALLGSDIDAYVLLPDRSIRPYGDINYEAASVLAKFPDYAQNITPSALYVTFPHVPTHTKVDLLFNNIEGGRNSKLLRYLLNLEDRIHSLAIVVKYWWERVQKMTGQKMIPNYGMSVMLVFYLQQVDILPPIATLQKNARPFVYDNWNSGFDELDYEIPNNNTLYQLLGEFFEFYEDFNYDEYIISPFMGRPVKRELFKKLSTVPEEFEYYRRNVIDKLEEPLDVTDNIIIQDVFLHNKNLAELLMDMESTESAPFWCAFERAALKYRETSETDFLDELLSVGHTKATPV